jgi:hypothetical protein
MAVRNGNFLESNALIEVRYIQFLWESHFE